MFFAMLIIFFIVMRASHGRRRRFVYLGYHHHWHGRHPYRLRMHDAPTANSLNVFEQLKQRYVSGDIDVEEYESQLDALLRAPETRKAIP